MLLRKDAHGLKIKGGGGKGTGCPFIDNVTCVSPYLVCSQEKLVFWKKGKENINSSVSKNTSFSWEQTRLHWLYLV